MKYPFFEGLAWALLGTAIVIPAGLGLIWLLQAMGLWQKVISPFMPFLKAFLGFLAKVGGVA